MLEGSSKRSSWPVSAGVKVAARVTLADQVIGHLDLVFPGLDGCFSDLLSARAGRVIVTDICDPDRVRRQGRWRRAWPPWRRPDGPTRTT